ncbi:MAG: hypothetical protein ABSC34_11370, partial [Acidimicrobiales bacterium]
MGAADASGDTVEFESSSGGSYTAISGCTSVSVTSDVAQCTTSTIPAGTTSVEGIYSSNTNYNTNTGTYPFTINSLPAPTVTLGAVDNATSSITGSTYGDSVTLTATMSAADASGDTVTFESSSGGSYAAISGCTNDAVASDVAQCTTSALPGGTTSVEGIYSGGADYSSATGIYSFGVAKITPTETLGALDNLTSSTTASTFGDSVTLTATMSAADLSGDAVEFEYSSGGSYTAISGCTSVSVTSDAAQCNTSALPAGTTSVEGIYSGGIGYNSVTGNDSFTVAQASTTTSVALPGNATTATVGTAVTITATISQAGNVNFLDNGTTITGCGSKAGTTTA